MRAKQGHYCYPFCIMLSPMPYIVV